MKKIFLILISFIIFNSALTMEVGEDENPKYSDDRKLINPISDENILPPELWIEILFDTAVALNPEIPNDSTHIYYCLSEIAEEVTKNITNLRLISTFFNVLLKNALQDAQYYNKLLKDKCIIVYGPIIRKRLLEYNQTQKAINPRNGDYESYVIKFLSSDNCSESTSSKENLNEQVLKLVVSKWAIEEERPIRKQKISLLIFCGAKMPKNGFKLLKTCIHQSDVQLAIVLVKKYRVSDNSDNSILMSAIHSAASNPRYLKLAKLLIKVCPNINSKSNKEEDGFTPLMRAAFSNVPALVKASLDRGADVTLKSKSGKTALQLVEGKNYFGNESQAINLREIINLLKSHSAKQNQTTNNGWCSLF